MKRIISFALVLGMVLCMFPIANADIDSPVVYINGQPLDCGAAAPIIQDGRTLVPIRAVLEALGADVNWDGETHTATASKNGEYCAVQIGSDTMQTGILQGCTPSGTPVQTAQQVLDVPAQIINDFTYIPLRAVSEALRAEVEWNGDAYAAYITTTEDKPADGWLYYASWSDGGGLYKIDSNGNNRQKLSDEDCYNIRYFEGYIYYTTRRNPERLYRVKTDGTGEIQLSEDRVAVKEMQDGWIYYSVLPSHSSNSYFNPSSLYKMRLDGSDVQLVTDDKVGDIAILGDTIYYSADANLEASSEPKLVSNIWDEIYHMYSISTDGTNRKQIGEDAFKLLELSSFTLKGDWIYAEIQIEEYVTEFYRISLDGKVLQKLTDNSSWPEQYTDTHIIYTSNSQDIRIVELDGKNDTLLAEGKSEAFYSGIYEDTIFYHYWGSKYDLDFPKHLIDSVWSVNIDGSNRTKILDGVVYACVYKGRLYCYMREPNDGLLSVALDGSDKIWYTHFPVYYMIEFENKMYYTLRDTNQVYTITDDGRKTYQLTKESTHYGRFVLNDVE